MWVSMFNLLTLGMKGKREQMEMLARQMRSGVGRIRAEGWKEGSVLACVLWNSLLWFVAEVTVRKPGCHCLRPATVCGRLCRHANMVQFFPSFSSSLPLGQFVCLLLGGLPPLCQTVLCRGGCCRDTEIRAGKFLCERPARPLCWYKG